MKIITDSPFRLLGVFTNTSEREVLGNMKRAKAYSRVGRTVAFGADLNSLFPPVVRDEAAIDQARAAITLPANRMRYALFWFVCASEADKAAIAHLDAGETDKAKALLDGKASFSALLNRGVIALTEKDYDTAMSVYSKFIDNKQYREAFVKAVCGEMAEFSKDDMRTAFYDTLKEEGVPLSVLVSACRTHASRDDYKFVSRLVKDSPLSVINSAIALSKQASELPMSQLRAGEELMTSTKSAIAELQEILGTDDNQYQMIANNLAERIFELSENYYRRDYSANSRLQRAKNALILEGYALSIAEDEELKQRIDDRTEALKQLIARISRQKISLFPLTPATDPATSETEEDAEEQDFSPDDTGDGDTGIRYTEKLGIIANIKIYGFVFLIIAAVIAIVFGVIYIGITYGWGPIKAILVIFGIITLIMRISGK